ncbi:hypothetical protein BC826DRAFT_1093685 [Russula brevipes]|nr:hypothetical protein BC826DRAFT_1093685 [Russula brevipes]
MSNPSADGGEDDGGLALDQSSPCRHCPNLPPWSTISVRLVGSHPLWAHHLWNAARALAGFLQRTPGLYVGRTVLELGAGGGLPGIVAAKCGARKVVLTDYPDQALVDNLAHNIVQNVEPARRGAVCVLGYIWGHPVGPLLRALLPDPFMRTQQRQAMHRALLATCEHATAPGGCVLVFYTHHLPHLAQRDMEFFEVAREMGWKCEKVLTERFRCPMFPEDSGEEEVRSTVHGWKLMRV